MSKITCSKEETKQLNTLPDKLLSKIYSKVYFRIKSDKVTDTKFYSILNLKRAYPYL